MPQFCVEKVILYAKNSSLPLIFAFADEVFTHSASQTCFTDAKNGFGPLKFNTAMLLKANFAFNLLSTALSNSFTAPEFCRVDVLDAIEGCYFEFGRGSENLSCTNRR
ncbi:hypothetical protein [Labilibaculum euxinus]|uniref:Uncharacterized protein n=1 Tax=Labilibaculum euxinus TaxID=2686357 RepID=A0A7M4D0R6_9BACT|nr:hypothetical protein [Labilibaculum euxinus]MUP36245.1 hypothetical protein [Labilibaculum euxinus]MVB05450.1 hypothetical protein [Labilibaculum euxinus]